MFCFSFGLGGGQVFVHTRTYQDAFWMGAGVAALATQTVLAVEGADLKGAVGGMPV